MYDLVIRNGTIIDGTGTPGKIADLAVRDGKIVEVGKVEEAGKEEFDARGLIVTPGFIDLHTHYDGQALWSSRLNPSSSHGVTTAILGNCGVGFAPCRPQDRELLCDTMEGVEDIPGAVMSEGLAWDWESFPEYLDALDAVPRDIDVGALLPHSPVRVYVMGKRGAEREPATDEDLAAMAQIVREGIAAGALGFGTSLTPIDRRKDGELVPSYAVATRELANAATAMKEAGGGLFQIVPELGSAGSTPEEDFAVLREVSEASDQPITVTVMEGRQHPGHSRRILELAHQHNAGGGARIHPQFLPRPLGMMASFDLTSNPFLHCPTYQSLLSLPKEERMAELRKPEVKAQIISEPPGEALLPITALSRQFDIMYELGNPPCYEPAPGTNVAARSKAEGRIPEDLAYDLLLEDDGRQMMLVAVGNFIDESMDAVIPYFEDSDTVIGLGDGGAHYGLICDASYPTYVLSHWTRDREGWRMPLEKAIQAMSQTPAHVAGLKDRGTIAPGMKADINVIDHENIILLRPFPVDDLPAGGRRLDQRANGYRATYVNGVAIQSDDQPTGALPGKLVRGRQEPQVEKLAQT